MAASTPHIWPTTGATTLPVAPQGEKGPEHLLWFANQLAPYRIPAWEALGRKVKLTIAVMGRAQANRPAWHTPTAADLNVRHLTPRLASSSSDSKWSGLVNPWAVKRLLADLQPTAVILPGWGDTAGLEVGLMSMACGTPRIAFYGSTPATRNEKSVISALRSRYLQTFNAIVSYGTATTHLLTADDNIDPSQIVTGFNTVDVAAIHSKVWDLRSGPGGPHRFLFVGQLIERKCPDLLLRAIRDPRLVDAVVTIVGAGPMESSLRTLVTTMGVSERVEFRGLVSASDMPSIYATHHTLVMPSQQEVWGLVANEALAAGLHVVISTAAGCAPDIANHRGVYLTQPEEVAVRETMVQSMSEFEGWTRNPSILAYGPQRLAEDILRSLAITR